VKPINAVVVLLDSLNRHMLGCYGGDEFATPNLDRLAARSARFERHVTGSLPCMPARHDLLVGAYDFLWRPWGSIELWEQPITVDLDAAGVTTMLVSDHPHLFETGGENYHVDFQAWEYARGHEGDAWKTAPDPSWVGTPTLPARTRSDRFYDVSRTYFRSEEDFPGPKVMRTAADWLDTNAGKHDQFFLFVDEFDPHEPFDTPAPWVNMYDPDWDDDLIIWPPYATKAVERGVITEREARHIRANYGSKLSMIDHWFGKLLDAFDRHDLWEDTLLVVCTDHGHYLGERDLFGKPNVMQYETLGHIPMLIAWPGAAPRTVDTLTTTVDIHATLRDVFAAASPHPTHGTSLVPLLEGSSVSERDTTREWAIGGVYGNWVQVTDGHRKYARSAVESNFPLSMWSNRWSTMPTHVRGVGLPKPDRRAYLDYMPHSDVPVIRQPFQPGDMLPFWVSGPVDRHHLFDLDNDPAEAEELAGAGSVTENEMVDMLVAALDAVEAPREQYERLGVG
jgi:arylsulfatase A-like enzyme